MNRKLRNFDSGTKVDIPVFVFPEELTFTDRELRRILTIYNPYDYRVQFRVLCSNPTNYVVRNPKGGIAPKTCVDVIIRFQLKEDGRSMSADKFRIDIYKEVTLIGRKTISAVFQFIDSANLTAQKQSKFAETEGSLTPITGSGEQPLNSNLFHMSCGFIMAIIISFFSVVLLFLPLDGDISSNFPQYLHVSHQLKLLAAFVLGMITMLFMKA